MDSPRSERSQTRYSTPVSDLDDHRFQPSSLPIVHASHSPTAARPTSAEDGGSGLPRITVASPPNSAAIDFENAIVDDDHSFIGPPNEYEGMYGRRGSASPVLVRRGTLQLSQQPADKVSRSRSSSGSSQSSSPPNSVDAFADPRRRERANTLDSKAPSELDLALQRTVSGGTRARRPTFDEGSQRPPEGPHDETKAEGEVEDDVCFPQPVEPSKTSIIDFEELEEFVAEYAQARMQLPTHRRKHSMSSQSPMPKIFNDLRPKSSLNDTHKGVSEGDLDEKDLDEKSVSGEKDEALGRVDSVKAPSVVETNRFSFFSSELDATIHAAELGDLIMPGESFRDLFELGPEGGVWWMDMLNPREEEITAICKAFSIHPLTAEDIKTQEAREKVELFKQYYFVCFRSFFQVDKTSEEYMEPVNVYIVVFREGVLSFTFCQSPHAVNVRKRIGRLRDYVSLSADWICYAMIDDIVDSFGPVIHDIEQETDVIEDQVFVARAEDFKTLLRQIGECRKKVMGLMRLLGGKADVIKGFAKRCNEQYSVTPRGEIGLYLGDIQDHVVTMMSNLGHFEKMLSRSHSNYLAQLSVDSIAQGNRANEVLSKITLIATILVPMNFICGLFGMNVPVPGKNTNDLGWFFGIIGVIAAVVVVSLIAAKRFKYI
ncbi:MAG: hypothetical protein M1819_004291 [Sarea resinae]|nr:MAG: hypothetical protein M1819_004291 [Sarea resinae]